MYLCRVIATSCGRSHGSHGESDFNDRGGARGKDEGCRRVGGRFERHYASVRVGEGSLEVSGDTRFDVVVDGVDGAFTATVDGDLKLAFVPAEGELPSRFEMRFTDEDRASAGCGRTVRWEPIDEVRNVRIVGDASSVEVFVNDGALVFSTRIYPEAYGVTVDAPGASVTYHTLNV